MPNKLSDSELRRLITYLVRVLEGGDLTAEQRRLVEQRYSLCISEAIRRARERMLNED